MACIPVKQTEPAQQRLRMLSPMEDVLPDLRRNHEHGKP